MTLGIAIDQGMMKKTPTMKETIPTIAKVLSVIFYRFIKIRIKYKNWILIKYKYMIILLGTKIKIITSINGCIIIKPTPERIHLEQPNPLNLPKPTHHNLSSKIKELQIHKRFR